MIHHIVKVFAVEYAADSGLKHQEGFLYFALTTYSTDIGGLFCI
jgi:hypothetical protein